MMKRPFYSTMFVVLCLVQPALSQLPWPAITAQTRPWTRWWWMGSAVSRQDLTANMEKYKAVGLGGLELTPIYGVKGYESQFLSYLSPEWMDRLSYTLKEARRLGLGLDMSTGTGWPFGGGPLIDSTYACKNFVYKSWVVKAGGTLEDEGGDAGRNGTAGDGAGGVVRFMQEALVHTDGTLKPAIGQLVEPVFANKDLQALALFQVRFEKWLPLQTLMAYSTDGKILDLTGKVDAAGHLNWTAPSGGGDWNLYAIFQGWHGKMVERAAPGAEGNVIDHFSSAALQKYLSRFDTAFKGRNLSELRAFFNDSYEVDDAKGQSNWTPDFFALFRQYRGYDLREHLPALFGKDIKENNERVLCDYRETISDLLLDKFTRGWRAWAKGKGAVIRNQAHGSPANILDLYAASDIPETEGQDVYRYKFATSAAHTTGKKLVSSESVTWLNEHFLSTLADVKKALDGYWLGGVNHVFYHGTAYSPQSDPWPGWLFYASVHFTPQDPSWENFGALNQYVARSQSFLQQGASDNDVLLYYPIYDSWSEPGHDLLKHYDRMELEFNGTGFKANAETLQRLGYSYDYISDRQVRQTDVVSAGAIRTSGGGLYQTLLLPDCRYISAAALRKLIGLAEGGATIVVYKELPSDVPGWGMQEARKNTFQQLLGRLHFTAGGDGIQKANIGKGVVMRGDDLGVLLTAAKIRRETMMGDSLEFVRRAYGQGNYYFIVNKSQRKWEGFVPLAADFRDAALFNPMDGRSGRALLLRREVYLQLLPGESVIVETSHSALTSALYPYYRTLGDPVEIKGEWKLDFFEGGPGLPASVRVNSLGSWTALEGEAVKRYSGTAKYTIAFDRPLAAIGGEGVPARRDDRSKTGKVRGWMLDLGKVDVTAQVFLNGNKIATLIGPYYQVEIPAAAIRAKNELEIRVSNGMANRIEDMDRKGVVWKKFYNYNFPAHVRENRNTNGLFDASAWKPFDSGLSGPVTLTAVEAGVPQSDDFRMPDAGKSGDPAWTREVGARAIPSATKNYSVHSYGAVGDGITLATHAIQSAIDDCAAKGGGVVVFEQGSYLSGALFLKEGVELRIGQGAEVKGSQHFEDYPLIDTRIAGIEMKRPAALLNIIGVKRAAITGAGKVNAQGKFCWDKYWAMRKEYDAKGLRWIVDYDAQRVRTLLIQEATDITINIRNITMDSVGNAILFTMNWNPAYSYSTLPKGYDPDSIPAHWKTMLHRVEPAERGIPRFKDIYILGLKAANAKKAISATGLDGSLITSVHIENSEIAAATAGAISYVKDWDFKNVIIHTKDGTRIDIANDRTRIDMTKDGTESMNP